MDQLTFLGSSPDFPLSTAWDGTDPNSSPDNPDVHRYVKPTDLGGLTDPRGLRRWVGIQNPVTPLAIQLFEETLLSVLSYGEGGRHNPNPPILH